MSVPGFRARIAALCCLIAFGLSSVAPAVAATVTLVQVNGQPSGGALLTLTFTGGVPTYHVVGAGSSDVSVTLDNTTFGSTVPPVIQGAGDITSVSAASTGTNSSLTLHLAAPAPVRVRPGNNSLLLDVSPAAGIPVNPFANPFSTPPVAAGLGPVVEVVFLKYADISEVAGLLSATSTIASNDNFSPQQSNIGTSSLTGSFGGGGSPYSTGAVQPQVFGGGAFGASSGLSQRVNDNIAVDRRLNAIVLSGSQDIVDGLKALIAKIDVPLQSVLLETQIVELDETASRNVGFDFSPDGTGAIAEASGGPTSTTGGGYVVHTLATANAQASFAANLYAQIISGNAKIIAKPRILAQSGQPASILTGDALPIITNIVSGTTSTISQQVNYVNVGVNLQIQPRISSDGFVTSHIYSEVSSVTGYTQSIPQISQRTASTIATVHDGDSFAIGGLLQQNEISTLTKIPFIGDIPIIGAFFRHLSTSKQETNLYLIVTPHIVGGASSGARPVPYYPSAPLPGATSVPASAATAIPNSTFHLSNPPGPGAATPTP